MESYRVRHQFSCSALPPDTFRVAEFKGTETISQPFRFEIELASADAEIDFEDVINKPATLSIGRGDDDPSEISGIVSHFVQLRQVRWENRHYYLYRVVLVPHLWRLTLSTQSRIFQDLTVQEIVTGVLEDAGVEHEWHLSESYEPREYTTQYKETDLEFVQRLLEFEGIRYAFQHEGGAETLILSDDAGDAQPIEGDDLLPYNTEGSTETDAVQSFVAHRQLVTAKTETKDYNYRTPAEALIATSEIDSVAATGISSDSMIHVDTQSRADYLTVIRNEEIESGRLVMEASSNCFRVRTGFRFALEEHFRSDLNQEYLVTHVTHSGKEANVLGSAGGEESGYKNEFTCVPASTPYRPPRLTPEPKLPGVLTAKVESAGGTYAPVDDQGRYRIRFPFDLGDGGAAQATKPVRLAQPYTGPGYGQHFPVHKDAEMVVACVDGNVDRIVGLSTVYYPTQDSPVTNENAAQNVWRTWGQNELTFDDTQGEELVYLRATKDHLSEIIDNQENHVGTNRTQTVGNDEALSVGRDQKEEVGRDNSMTVGRDQTLLVGSNRQITVGTSHTENIGSSMSVTVGVSASETVGTVKTVNVGAAYAVSIGAGYQVSVGAVSSESVGGAKSLTASGPISYSAGATYEVTVGTDISWTAGKEGKLVVGKKLFVESGDDLSIKGGKKMSIEAADQLTLKCGKASIIMKKNGDITIKGKKAHVKASGDIILKGSKIAEN